MPTSDGWWRTSEVRLLRSAIPRSRTWAEVAEIVGTRGPGACSAYARKHGLGGLRPLPRRWTEEEDEVLRREWPVGTDVHELARRLGRTEKALAERAFAIGLSGLGRREVVQRRLSAALWARGRSDAR